MISEEMLKRAAAEADQAIRESLPAPEECKHEFSPLFQKKMHRIFRKAKHPVLYKLPKRVACFILVAILFSGTWLTFDVEARAAFFAWVREQYETFVEYRFTGQFPIENVDKQYEPTWLPEGFSMLKTRVASEKTYITYENDSGERITFSYLKGNDALSLFLASDYEKIYSVQVGNNSAEFYEAAEESSANALVWISEDDICFCIIGAFPEGTLVKMAESVQEK